MSKLSFRSRALDASKPMPVYKTEEIPDLPDFSAIRAVPQMPTGMEKEEETEHHLQAALSAQQVYGTAEALVIPIPDIDQVTSTYKRLYEPEGGYKPPRQYIHVQPFGMDQEIPDYDMDSEDESWLGKQSRKLEVTQLKFETMMDRLEKGSGQTVMTLNEAKALLKEDDDLIIAVYDYWLNKRLKLQHALIPTVRTEKGAGSTSNNPYVAFRRRFERMLTRKNRKNDEVSYEKMLKLRRDLNKALTILELMKRREKSKKELLKLTIEIVEKRYQMQDFDGKVYSEANAKRHTLPSSFIQSYSEYINARKWADRASRREQQEEQTYSKKTKRKYNKRKEQRERSTSNLHHHHHHHHHHHTQQLAAPSSQPPQPAVQLPQYTEVEVLHEQAYSSEEELSPQPLSASDHEQDSENDPDGPYAFRRKPGCHYHAPIEVGRGNWPWHGQEDGGFGDTKYRYSLTSLAQPTRRCLGFSRRRFGRGGRMMLDRMTSEWDGVLEGMDLTSAGQEDDTASAYTEHIHQHNIPHFRPLTPVDEDRLAQSEGRLLDGSRLSPPLSLSEFSLETYEQHRQQVLQMTKAQQEHQNSQDGGGSHQGGSTLSNSGVTGGFHSYASGDLELPSNVLSDSSSSLLGQSFSSQPNSKFTLDSERAHFAASAVCVTSQQTTVTSSKSVQSVTSSGTSLLASRATSDVTFSTVTSVMTSVIAGSSRSRTNSPTVFQNGPIEVKPSVFSTSPAANVLQLNYPISEAASIATPSNQSAPLATATISLVNPGNVSNNASGVAGSLSLITPANSSTGLKTASLATGTLSLVTHNNEHSLSGTAARTALHATSTAVVNNSSLFPVSMATKCVSPATPALLKIASTATAQHRKAEVISKETLEGASILKDKAVAMEVT